MDRNARIIEKAGLGQGEGTGVDAGDQGTVAAGATRVDWDCDRGEVRPTVSLQRMPGGGAAVGVPANPRERTTAIAAPRTDVGCRNDRNMDGLRFRQRLSRSFPEHILLGVMPATAPVRKRY